MKDYLTIQEAAKELNVHEQTVRNWIRDGVLTAFTRPGQGRQKFVRKGDIEKQKQFKPAS